MTRSHDELEEWILRARQVDSWPSMPAQARVWSAIERRLAVGPPPVSIGHVGTGSTIGASKLMLVLAIVTSVGAPLIGGIAAAAVIGDDDGAIETPAPVVVRRDPPPRPAVSMIATSPVVHDDGPIEVFDEGPEELDDVEIFVEPEDGRRQRAVRRGSGAPSSDLAVETRLLRGVRAQLRHGDIGEANALLAEHRERFPRGMLVDLRAALEIDAQCRLGHTERARALAGAFERTYPSSPYRARTDECDGGGQP